MPTIQIPETQRDTLQGATVFDPANTNQHSSVGKNFSLLRSGTTHHNLNLGGRFSLPIAFEAKKFASKFAEEGNEVEAMQRDQPVMGTGYVADGWKVWKHPQTGETHKISPLDNKGSAFVLMYRPIEVQSQVNEAYGLLSIDNMAAEARGDTIAGTDPNSREARSMLSTKHLSKVEGAEIAADAEYEESMGKSTVVASTLTNSGRLTKPPVVLAGSKIKSKK